MAKLIDSCELFTATVRGFSKIASLSTFASNFLLVKLEASAARENGWWNQSSHVMHHILKT